MKQSVILLLSCLILSMANLFGQKQQPDPDKKHMHYLKPEIIDGDTIPNILLNEVTIIPPWNFTNRREEVRYTRLVRNIKITLPFARLAAEKLKEINDGMAKIKGDKERKHYLKEAERNLFAEFEQPLRRLSFAQGRLLIRLIDRETGNTSYDLIREYKGGVPAFFWQGIARIFGANLKDQYDAENDDKMVEHIISLIDAGIL
jgi:hypothetical protein